MKLEVAAILLGVILVSGHSFVFAAKPWDLIISAKFEQAQIEAVQNPVLMGKIVDQKGVPVYGADVKIRFSDASVSTKTDKDGNFRYEFEQQPDGIFVASISAVIGELKGMSKTTIKIGSGVTTPGDLYYNSNFDKSFRNDTYKSLKQKQYQKYIEEKNKRIQKISELDAKKALLQERRSIADQKKLADINETKPGDGVYSTEEQDKHTSKMPSKIKDITKMQMGYTRDIYEQAKFEMNKVLEKGGTMQEAKKAYLKKLATTHNMTESVGSANNTESHSKIIKHDTTKNKKVRGLTYSKYFK